MLKNLKLVIGGVILSFAIAAVLWWQNQAANDASRKLHETPLRSELSGPVKDLQVMDIKLGEGAPAKHGDRLQIHYSGWLYDPSKPESKGNKFDSSQDRGKPFSFKLGAGQVLPGLDRGVEGLKPGGKRRLLIPPDLGYGQNGAGAAIPPNATLLFEIELVTSAKE